MTDADILEVKYPENVETKWGTIGVTDPGDNSDNLYIFFLDDGDEDSYFRAGGITISPKDFDEAKGIIDICLKNGELKNKSAFEIQKGIYKVFLQKRIKIIACDIEELLEN